MKFNEGIFLLEKSRQTAPAPAAQKSKRKRFQIEKAYRECEMTRGKNKNRRNLPLL